MKNSAVVRPLPKPSREVPVPKPPRGLSTEARRWWRTIRNEYDIKDGAGLLLLQTAAEQFARMRTEEVVIDREGSTIKDRFGQPKQHPAVLNAREARSAMLRCLAALNLDLEPVKDSVGRPGGSVSYPRK
jgi:P27 family predicted phage terminase small subunit